MATECTNSPLFGLWKPQNHLKHLYYGPGCVQQHLLGVLPLSSSKVFIITGTSIATHTPLVQSLEQLLGHHHAGTYTGIKQHGLAEGVDEATRIISDINSVDTILSVGGGSPIDSAKTISWRIHDKTGHFLTHIAIPTTLSAAECTAGGGFTKADGTKVGFMHPGMGVTAIFFDATFARYTPKRLWLSTGMRAVDHAVETMYHPHASEVPWKALAIWAMGSLAENPPRAKGIHGTEEANDVTTSLQLASFASSGLRGSNFQGGMGLSHSLGHALGSPYGIPHGETSCLTLAAVIRYKAEMSESAAQQIARLLPVLGSKQQQHGDEKKADSAKVAQHVEELVETLGLAQLSLSERGIGRDQVEVIANRATGGNPSESIIRLVEGFF